MKNTRAQAFAQRATVDTAIEVLRLTLVSASAMALILAGWHWSF